MARGALCCVGLPCLAVLAALCVVTRLFAPRFIDQQISAGIRENIVLNPSVSRDIYDSFLNNTQSDASPTYMKFYFFNITNLEDVREKGSKPVLEELGPYTYRVYYSRFDVDFNFDGHIQYKDYKYYVPEPSMSAGSFDDKIFTLNIPLVGALSRIGNDYESSFVRWALGLATKQISSWSDEDAFGLFARRTVSQLLWGYEDPLLKQLSRFVDVDEVVAFFVNGTRDSEAEMLNIMNTGLKDLSEIGQYEMWEGEVEHEWTTHQEKVRGTDGTRFFPEVVKVDQAVDIWVGDLYRTLTLRGKEVKDFSGVEVVRFELDDGVLIPNAYYDQSILGLINVTKPMTRAQGAPVYFSLPHFCRSSEALKNGVVGMSCDPERHTLFVDVEPNTGLAIRGGKRLMLSSEFGPAFSQVEPNVVQTVLPIFWVDGAEEATEDQLDLIKDSIYWAQDVSRHTRTASLVGSIVFLFLLVALFACVTIRAKYIRRKLKAKQDQVTQVEMQTGPPDRGLILDVDVEAGEGGQDMSSPLVRHGSVLPTSRPIDSALSWDLDESGIAINPLALESNNSLRSRPSDRI
ncbi:hypothetical protein BSKO_03714 [Bryopsis sp. KO-2023]|nr:hypothetical protein BSKO_03714 [Bryopsis sp. KO-2023]